MTAIATAQECPIDPLTPITIRFGIGGSGNPESSFPLVPLYWNRYYKANENTGQLESVTCAYTGDPNLSWFAYCACFLPGTYFRKVNDACDVTPCGGDLSLPILPKTNNNNASGSWSAGATWTSGLLPEIDSVPAILVTKATQIDMDLNFPARHWLIFTTGNSTILAGKTVTANSVMQVYPSAQLTNFGILKGSGQVMGSLINSGTLAPGNSPGKFTIAGNYTATATAIHQIEIAAANSFDTINVASDPSAASGIATINGTLTVDLLNGFVPAAGDTFRIFSFVSATGIFTNSNLPILPAGLSWETHYNATNISLAVINTVPLPLHFTNTKAVPKNSGIQISWDAESERQVMRYEIERSSNGTDFTTMSKIAANTNNGTTNHYSWLDAAPVNGNNYYRIKAIDLDGKFMYSAVLLVKTTGTKSIVVYPNPAKRGASLLLSLQNVIANKIEVLNFSGQTVYSKSGVFTGNISIPITAAWPAGQYALRLSFEDGIEMKKIIVY
jgi:hypothetical protein